jgi:hypothetical protein
MTKFDYAVNEKEAWLKQPEGYYLSHFNEMHGGATYSVAQETTHQFQKRNIWFRGLTEWPYKHRELESRNDTVYGCTYEDLIKGTKQWESLNYPHPFITKTVKCTYNTAALNYGEVYNDFRIKISQSWPNPTKFNVYAGLDSIDDGGIHANCTILTPYKKTSTTTTTLSL